MWYDNWYITNQKNVRDIIYDHVYIINDKNQERFSSFEDNWQYNLPKSTQKKRQQYFLSIPS